jgi:diguanylate cyclase (GGDEF)-like protein
MGVRVDVPAKDGKSDRKLGQGDTERLIEQTKKLAQLNSWFEVALNNMARGLSMFDAEGRLIVCNAIYREIYELPEDLVQPGTHIADLVAYHAKKEGGRDTPADRERQRRWIERHLAELARGKTFTHTQRLKNGRIILVTNQPLAEGGWVDIQEDVTEKTRAQDRIAWLARHDSLTEAANRFHFGEQLDQKIKELPAGSLLAVHLIDLDRFKPINDTLGHAAGDTLLRAVAKRMRATVRENDIVGRLGGDEFAIIQVDITDGSQAESLAKRLLKVLNSPYRVLGNLANIGASVGIVLAPQHGKDTGSLLKRADLAMYRVKSNGRGAYAFYEPELEKMALQRDELEADLHAAFAARALELHYQPIVELRSRRVTSCEALMRWRHPKLGMVPPATFIPIAEKSRLIVDLGAWAIHRACSDAVLWPADIKVTVNLSAKQFELGDPFVSTSEALAKSGLPANRLELEITETVLMRNEQRTKSILENLRALGVGIALDDFGTAFASLSYLREFTFDKLKIDRSFVREVTQRKDCLAIINAVTGLARSLELCTVAEGIETDEQLARVQVAGCNEVQGFYFSRPVPASELYAALAQCHEKRGQGVGDA